MSPTIGIVRSWNLEEGWGVIDSPETPGGCWVHATTPSTKTRMGLDLGRRVYFEWERLPGKGVQDGFDFVATDAWYVGEEPYRRPQGPSSAAFSTSLTITFDDGPDHKDHRIPLFGSRGEQVLTATWIARQGLHLVSSDLPDAWVNALGRVGHDLNVRQYGGVVERIDWVAEYQPDSGYVFLLSDVTVLGRGPSGLGMSGSAAQVDDEVESVVVCIADLVQDQVARAHVAWPWGDTGGFMTPRLVDAVAVWSGKGHHRGIGSL